MTNWTYQLTPTLVIMPGDTFQMSVGTLTPSSSIQVTADAGLFNPPSQGDLVIDVPTSGLSSAQTVMSTAAGREYSLTWDDGLGAARRGANNVFAQQRTTIRVGGGGGNDKGLQARAATAAAKPKAKAATAKKPAPKKPAAKPAPKKPAKRS